MSTATLNPETTIPSQTKTASLYGYPRLKTERDEFSSMKLPALIAAADLEVATAVTEAFESEDLQAKCLRQCLRGLSTADAIRLIAAPIQARESARQEKIRDCEPNLNKTQLKARGWTDSQIKNFLGAPDWNTVNPKYACAAPVCHYRAARVTAIEASAEFIESQAKGAKRRAGAAKAVETKKQQLRAFLGGLVVVVPKIERRELTRLACESYNSFNSERGFYASPDFDRDFLARIAVNYLRHELSCYEETLDEITGKVGAADAYLEVKDKVLDAIGKTYPDLFYECNRQSDRARELACSRW
jgi:hypothetical protein